MTVTDSQHQARMQVRKRNGDSEAVDVNKIVRAVRPVCQRARRCGPAAGCTQRPSACPPTDPDPEPDKAEALV